MMSLGSLRGAFFLLAVFAALPAFAKDSANKTSTMKEGSVVELRMVKFTGDDGYPLYETVDPNGPMGDAKISLRCIDNGYDVNAQGKTVSWKYHELMVFDSEKGREIKRKEPRGNVASEKGWNFKFKNFDECEKAAPNMSDANCTMTVKLSRSRGLASLVSSGCKPVESSKPGTGGSSVPVKPTTR